MFWEDFAMVDLKSPEDVPPENSAKMKRIVSLKNLLKYFREYCGATSIHGFRYFGESRTLCEKIWWLTAFSICLLLCVFSILSVYRKWDQSPVIVTFATKGKPITDIPFPAVTICAESKVNHAVFDYKAAVTRKRRGDILSEKEEDLLTTSLYVCNYLENFNHSSLKYSESAFFLDILREVSPDFVIMNCKFLGKLYPCNELFTPLITEEGFCYTFNMLDRTEMFNKNVVYYRDFHNINKTSEDWSLIHGYSDEANVMTYPRRALVAGARFGLNFELKIDEEGSNSLCRGAVEGYRLVFHAPMAFPHPSQEYIRVPYNRALSTPITPSQILTSEAVKNYPPEKRQCYFPFEKKLKYFKVYSARNCDTECLTNFTLSFCQCVLFYMPSRENGTRICSAQDYVCATEAEYNLQYLRVYNKVMAKSKKIPQYVKENICHCKPMCSDVAYKVGSSMSVWRWSEEVESGSLNYTANGTKWNLSKVSAYFVNSNFIGSERNELYGPTDFLANFGGLLGLFTGFSILSLIEIIYFLTVRLVCNVRLYGNWTGQGS